MAFEIRNSKKVENENIFQEGKDKVHFSNTIRDQIRDIQYIPYRMIGNSFFHPPNPSKFDEMTDEAIFPGK